MTNNNESPTSNESPTKKVKVSKSLRLLLTLLAIGTVLLIAGVTGAVMISNGQAPSFFEKPRVLHLKITPMILEAPGGESLLSDPENLPPLSTEIARLIKDASKDNNITKVKLEVQSVTMGWAQTQEIRSALLDFIESGKECQAWAESYSNKEYYLAAPCNEIYMAPAGVTMINGLSITQTYYADMFKNLDISPNFAHVGDFKSAVEPYERTGPSEAASEATNALLDSLYGQLKEGMSGSKQLSEENIKQLLDNPPITPEAAKQQGLVTDLKYRNEVFTEEKDAKISTSNYLRKRRRAWQQATDKIAVVYASGAIVNGASGTSMFGGQFIGDKTLRGYLKKVRTTPSIKALVLRVNSPGGSGSASDNIWYEIERIKKTGKPVVVSMGDYAASGGYYISMGADKIYAQPGTLTGSIGVFGGKLNIAGLYNKLGMTMHTYERGQHSTLFSEVQNFTPQQKAKYQEFLESFYKIFVTKASTGRNMSYEDLHKVAQGRVWTGKQALEHKLIDELGGLEDAIAHAAQAAKLNDYGISIMPKRKTFFESLLEEISNPNKEDAMVPSDLRNAADQALLLDGILRKDGWAAMLPGTIKVD